MLPFISVTTVIIKWRRTDSRSLPCIVFNSIAPRSSSGHVQRCGQESDHANVVCFLDYRYFVVFWLPLLLRGALVPLVEHNAIQFSDLSNGVLQVDYTNLAGADCTQCRAPVPVDFRVRKS